MESLHSIYSSVFCRASEHFSRPFEPGDSQISRFLRWDSIVLGGKPRLPWNSRISPQSSCNSEINGVKGAPIHDAAEAGNIVGIWCEGELRYRPGLTPIQVQLRTQHCTGRVPPKWHNYLFNTERTSRLKICFGNTPLLNLACSDNNAAVIEFLLLKGANVNARNHNGETALSCAV